jgi:kumamolisin
MPSEPLIPLPGSERASLPGAADAEPADADARLELTVMLRRRAAGELGAASADVELVRSVLSGLGLSVTSADAASRRVKVSGTVGELAAAFGTSLRMVSSGGVTHRYREGGLFVPRSLDGVVTAVLGLDDRPQARPHFRTRATAPAPAAPAPAAPAPAAPAPAAPTSYTPGQVASAYGFPPGTDGTGQVVALVELGGGFSQTDLTAYFASLDLPVPSVTAESVDGASNAPGSDPGGADVEVSLDVDVLGAAAPGATQLVYFAPNTDQGFVDSVSDAAHASPTPVAISISWGQSEDSWTAQARTALDDAIADACALGITVCVAAGDNGSSDGVSDGKAHVDFPASSPHALACGGTRLVFSGGSIESEVVWNDGSGSGAGGGGVSDTFARPSWQATAGVPASANAKATGHSSKKATSGRGVPDVSGNADPETGYQIMADGQLQVVGGTSAVAPLWAALIARLAQATGKRFGLIQPALYAHARSGIEAGGFHDIRSGNNGAYSAGPGWDACTGLGSPDGPALLGILK